MNFSTSYCFKFLFGKNLPYVLTKRNSPPNGEIMKTMAHLKFAFSNLTIDITLDFFPSTKIDNQRSAESFKRFDFNIASTLF